MYLANHPANRLINDFTMWLELMAENTLYNNESKWAKGQLLGLKMGSPFSRNGMTEHDEAHFIFLGVPGKIYLVTNTVIEKLQYLKTKGGSNLDWSVFQSAKIHAATFILPNNEVLRIADQGSVIMILLISFTSIEPKKNHAKMKVDYVYITKDDWKPGIHLIEDEYMQGRAEYIYKLMAFIYLSELEEEILKPGERKGTKKAGKIINSLGKDITIINSKWNITSIRNEQFGVSGHFAIRWCGQGRTDPKVVWIGPFTKNGYIRKAKSEQIKI